MIFPDNIHVITVITAVDLQQQKLIVQNNWFIIYVAAVFMVWACGKNCGFCIKGATFPIGGAVVVSQRSSVASRLPFWDIFCSTFEHFISDITLKVLLLAFLSTVLLFIVPVLRISNHKCLLSVWFDKRWNFLSRWWLLVS
jgi:hypothetical protein